MASSLTNKNKEFLKTVISIYIPGFFIQLGTSLTLPFDPLYSHSLGASIGMIGLIAAAAGIGRVIFDLPGGWIAGKISGKTFLILSASMLSLAIFAKSLVQTPIQLLLINIFIGMGNASWGIGQLAYMQKNVSKNVRGKSLAFMGGIFRTTSIISPIFGGFLIKFFGFRLIYSIQGILVILALFATIFLIKKIPATKKGTGSTHQVIKKTFKENGKNICIAMLGIAGLQILRMSRNLLFPLWASHIGITIEVIGTLSSIGGLIETLMAIPDGIVMDRYGRKFIAVPCTLGFGISLALLSFTSGIIGLTIITILMSVANGFGSGINMTISTDLAPAQAVTEFLGIWRFTSDSSQITAPIIAGAIAQAFTLAIAPCVAGAIGIAAGFIFLFGMKETKS
jgi:MFS family permease